MEYKTGEKILCGKNNMGKYITIYDKYATIDIGNNLITLIDLDDIDKCKDYNWYIGSSGYVITNIRIDKKVKSILLHRLIMNTILDKHTDHINHNNLDNRKYNLRICSISENHMNVISKTGSSKYKGVYYNKKSNKYISYIGIGNNKQLNLGRFDNEIDAAKAYNEAAIKYFGEFCCLNEI